jgi:hypothetical protein
MTSLLAPAISRAALPKPTNRLSLGQSGLQVSPLCIGIVGDPEIIPAAFDAGVNFFFVSGDLHWRLYEGLRKGLELLFARGKAIRDQIVVGAVSYLDPPLFQALQFNEIIDEVKGLERIDLLLAGAVWSAQNLQARLDPMQRLRNIGYLGSRAIGASFHDRQTALLSINYEALDIQFIRYNTAHPGARTDMFPHLRDDRRSRIFNFKSMMSRVTSERFRQLGLYGSYWEPKATDYYRFALSPPAMDGMLCSPNTLDEFEQLIQALEGKPLTLQEEQYMIWLSSVGSMRFFE